MSEATPIPRLPRQGSYELSAYQRGIWSLVQASPDNPFYNASRILKMIGPFDLGRFHRALETAIARHDILRASFASTERGPVQRVASAVAIDLPLEDLSDLPSARREARLGQWIRDTAWMPFDLEAAPLIRCRAFRFADEDHRLVMTAHHIVSDGGSGRLLIEELAALYLKLGEGAPMPPPPDLQYHDFGHWQNEQLASGAMAESEAYWLRRLGGELPALELPADRQRPPVSSYRGAQYQRLLSAGLTGRLKELRRKQGTTIFRVMLAALDTFLCRLSGETDVIVGSPVSGRTHPALRDVQGLFVNMLALRADLRSDPPFAEVLAQIKRTSREDIDHKDFPFDLLIQRLNPRRDPGRPPIFNVVLVMREHSFASELAAGTLVISQDEVPLTRVSRYDLTLIVAETAPGLRLTFEYNTDLFEPSTMVRMAGNLEQLLEGVVLSPGAPISRLPLLTAAERAAVLLEWNDTEREPADARLLHQRFADQAAASPDRVAVVFETGQLTYRQLNGLANQLAHYLRRMGVGPEVLVGICLERSLDLVVGLLGILKAGGAYVPLDPSYPRPRLEHMLEDSRVPIVLTHGGLAADLPSRGIRWVLLDGDRQAIARESCQDPASGAVPENAAYVIYTSGSTGSPKGALNTHRAICNRLLWMQEAYSLTAADRVLQKTPISFDVSVWEFFWPLLAGACLVVARPDVHREGAELVRLIAGQEITTLHFVPSMLQAFLAEEGVEGCRCLKRVFCSGEALSPELERRFATRLQAELHNLYGPTEAAVDVTSWACGRTGEERSVPIGRPIANLQIVVLDRDGNPAPIGVPGELHIGGQGLARGYFGRPGLTAASFVPHPHAGEPGARLYRTGDLARYRPDGNLEYIGRLDHQVKIRGVRIELGEIETALQRHPAVKEAVAVVRENPAGDRHLVACVVPRREPPPTAAELRGFLAARLPAVMVPAFFVMLDAIALTPSGKVDRASLMAASARARAPESVYVAPRDPLEWELTGLWEELLGAQGIGVLDNFFDIGGHSLLAVSLAAGIHRRFGIAVPAAAVLQAPTIADLSVLLRARGHAGRTAARSGNLVPIRSGAPSQPPLLLVHAHRGGVFVYHALARALGGSYPIYGLQASGLDEGEEPLDSVPAMAARYVDQIRALQPRGPYRLVGWSFGGLVAYEMARQLESGGEQVAILALIDCSPPGDIASAALAGDSLPHIGRAFFGLEDEALAGLDESRSLQVLLARGRDRNLLPAGMTAESLGRLIRVVRAHTQALSTYLPTDGIRADICLLLAATASQVRDPGAWRGRTSGAYSVVTVPGAHHEMVFPPAVGELAAALHLSLAGGAA
ncbi:MAG: non-ribosomal peptide synthetase [Thermoanaerobaculia bacterium]